MSRAHLATHVRKWFSDPSHCTPEMFTNHAALLYGLRKFTLASPAIVKTPAWMHDSTIVRLSPAETPSLCSAPLAIKIHPDLYPLASHLYHSPHLLRRLARSIHAATVLATFTTVRNDLPYRVVIYEFVAGNPLDTLIPSSTDDDLREFRLLLRCCTSALLRLGLNPFIKDLGDFVLVRSRAATPRAVLTDYNALLDCSRAPLAARTGIMTVLDDVIERVVSRSYKPYTTRRPTMV